MRHALLALPLLATIVLASFDSRALAPAFAEASAGRQDRQDDAQIQDLIRKLDDSDFQTREDAFQALVKIGPKALPLLREALAKTESAEVRLRAGEAVRAIELAEKAARVYREPKRITADFKDAPLAEALEEIAKQAGVKLEGLANAPDRRLTLRLDDATLFEALDRVCALQEQLTYDHRSEGVATLAKEKHPSWPAAYAGPFRVRIADLTVTRTTDFKTSTVTAQLQVATDHEQHLKPLARVRFDITKAVDDTGAELEVTRGGASQSIAVAGGVVVWAGGVGRAIELDRMFGLRKFGEGAAALRVLRGSAVFSFPLEQSEIKFESPTSGDRKDAGDFTFRILRAAGRFYEIEIARARGAEALTPEEIDRRLDTDSFVLVDGDGKEHKADSVAPAMQSGVIVIGPGGTPERKIQYRVVFGAAKLRDAKELRLRFVDKTLEKTVPFELKDVKLP